MPTETFGRPKRRPSDRLYFVDRWHPDQRVWQQIGMPFETLDAAEDYVRRFRRGGGSGVLALLRLRDELVDDYIPPGYGEAA